MVSLRFLSVSKIIILALMLSLQACGVNIIEKQDCIPKVNYVSTKSVKMFLVKVVDPEFSYSELKIKSDERFLCVSVPNMLDCDDSFGKLKVTNLLEGTFLTLSGKVRRIEPFGFSTAFKSDMTYLEGVVNDTIVWIPLFRLNAFAEYESESTLNTQSNKTLGITDSSLVTSLDCFD